MLNTPDWLTEFVREAMEREQRRHADPAWFREKAGMTLFGTLGLEAVLRADGSVWLYEAVDWEHSEEYAWRQATAQEAAGSLKVGASRFPKLAELIPPNPSDAPCPACGGSGELTFDGGSFPGVWCQECSGVGYLVDEAT